MKLKNKQIKEIQGLAAQAMASVDSEEAFLRGLLNSDTSRLSTIYKTHNDILANRIGQLRAYKNVIKILEINEQTH